MFVRNKNALVICLSLTLGAVFAAAADIAAPRQLSSAANDAGRPSRVPADYVITPFGYMHPSCVNEVRAGETQRRDGRFQDAQGRVREVSACTLPRYDRRGDTHYDAVAEPFGLATPPPVANGWVGSANNATLGNLEWISADWVVPTFPYSQGSQVIYYFPGLEDTRNVVTIQQPVMGWNAFNDKAWTIASWNCCVSGVANHSAPVTVRSGDSITGYAWGYNCDTSGLCGNWQVSTRDNSLNSSTIYATQAFGQRFNWSFGGALEAYGISNCQEFPASGQLSFTSIWLRNIAHTWISSVPWTTGINAGFPSCSFGIGIGSQSVTITNRNTVPAGVLTPAAPTNCGRLNPGQGLTAGKALSSCDGRFVLAMQLDGNLVLYQGATALWNSRTYSTTTFSAIMQGDGNFVAYDLSNRARWNSVTYGNAGAFLAVQNDGNLVVYSAAGRALWASNTCCR